MVFVTVQPYLYLKHWALILSLKYMLLFAFDLSAHLTASVSPLDLLCLVNRNSIRLIGAGQSTHNLQAAVTQEDRSFSLSSLRWGKVDCLMGGSACSWLLFQFPDLFYLPQLCSELWWSVAGENIPEANPDCVWIPDSSRITCPAAPSPFLSCSWESQWSSPRVALAVAVCCQQLSFLVTVWFWTVSHSWILWCSAAALTSRCPSTAAPRVLCKQSTCGLPAERCQVAQPFVLGEPGGFTRTLSCLGKAAERASLNFLLAMIVFPLCQH